MAKVKKIQRSTVYAGAPVWANIRPDIQTRKVEGIVRDYNRLLWDARYFVHNDVDDSVKIKSAIRYANQVCGKTVADNLRRVSDSKLAPLGVYTFMIEHGAQLDAVLVANLERHLRDLAAAAPAPVVEVEAPKQTNTRVLTIAERMREQLGILCAQWNGLIDDVLMGKIAADAFQPDQLIRVFSMEHTPIKAAHAKMLRGIYARDYREAQDVAANKDAMIREGFSNLDARQRRTYLELFQRIMNACDTVINSGKAVRKARKPKPRKVEKVIAKVKYKANDAKLGLVSIAPDAILRAKVLWIYNTKTRKLGVYVADERAEALNIRGTTILNFDETKSVARTVRKPDVALKGIGKLTRAKTQKTFDDLSTAEIRLNGRLNEHTILISAF